MRGEGGGGIWWVGDRPFIRQTVYFPKVQKMGTITKYENALITDILLSEGHAYSRPIPTPTLNSI